MTMLNKAIIDLNVLDENAEKIKSKLKKGVKFCAVVKADAYGHGAERVSASLYKSVDCFAVALVEEGIKLRLSGIDKDILVLIPPFSEDLKRAVFYNLTLSVDNVQTLKEIEKECEKQNKFIKVHLVFNSGMNRLGTDLNGIKTLVKFMPKCPHIILDGMFSHYASPENPWALNNATDKFLLAKDVVKSYNNNAVCHISASGGFIVGKQFDMVRIGILLYGYQPFNSDFIKVKPVMQVKIPVIKTRTLNAGECALYGLKKSYKKTKISLVRYGYADGLERKEIYGQFNNRCMDLSAVTDCKDKEYCILDCENLAEKYGTIPYEILCKFAMRTEKIYKR